MKHFTWITLILACGFLLVLAVALPAKTAQALPEYSAQTGEPCASCHISPSGGGPRGPRGQAWVGSGKPGAVPDLLSAMEVLGVHLEVDQSAFTVIPESIPPAQPLQVKPSRVDAIHRHLSGYAGN